MKEPTFSTTNISTAAALLATGKLELVDVVDQGHRKKMLIAPRITAKEIYAELKKDRLMINASQNDYWVNRLKDVIFGNKTVENIKRSGGRNGENY